MKKEENDDELVAVIKITIGENEYLVPLDNWNKAVKEERTNPVILGDELHFFNDKDYEKIKRTNDLFK